jgi:hypothetical protein
MEYDNNHFIIASRAYSLHVQCKNLRFFDYFFKIVEFTVDPGAYALGNQNYILSKIKFIIHSFHIKMEIVLIGKNKEKVQNKTLNL